MERIQVIHLRLSHEGFMGHCPACDSTLFEANLDYTCKCGQKVYFKDEDVKKKLHEELYSHSKNLRFYKKRVEDEEETIIKN